MTLMADERRRLRARAGDRRVARPDRRASTRWGAGRGRARSSCARPSRARGFPEPPGGLTDSKRLTAKRRAELAAELPGWVEAYAIGSASHEEIDALGMTAALRLAARAALGQLPERPDVVLLDGKHDYIGSPWRVRTAVKADLRSVSVAAASVLAKVHRDALMAELGRDLPGLRLRRQRGLPGAGAPAGPGGARPDPVPPPVLVLPGRPPRLAPPEEAPPGNRGPAHAAVSPRRHRAVGAPGDPLRFTAGFSCIGFRCIG